MPDLTGKTLVGISKTTLSGVLTALIGIFTSLLAFQIPAALQTPQETHIWLWVTVGLNIASIVCKAILGAVQGDAPTS